MRRHSAPSRTAALRHLSPPVVVAVTGLVAVLGGLTMALAQDGTVIINPGLQVRVSPAYLVQDVPMPVNILVQDATGRGVVGATVRLTNATDPRTVLAMGVTGAGGRALVGPARATAAEATSGVRVEVSGTSGTRSDLILRVRAAASAFSVLEARIIEPAEGARPSLREGEPLRIIGLLRGIGTGTVTGWWEVNGMPVAPFTARMQSGAPVRVEPRDPALLSARLRPGPNDIRIRTLVPNELSSRNTPIDVYRDLAAVARGTARVQSAQFLLAGVPAGHCLTAVGVAPALAVEVLGEGTGQVSAEWWLDGAFVDQFEALMRDGSTGPLRVPASLLPVSADATHWLRLRVTNPNAADSPVFAYDVGTARGSQPASISLLTPAEGSEADGLPPLFRWTAVPAALQYRITVETGEGEEAQTVWTGAASPSAGDVVEMRAPAYVLFEPGVTYSWRVVALRPSQDAPTSEPGTFRIPAGPSQGGEAQ